MPPTTTATPCYSSRHFAILRTLLNAHLDDYRAVWFATSPYVQPQTLLWFRIVITVYTVIITFINIFIRHPEMWQWWSAMTHISWIGVFLYFFVNCLS